MIPSLCINLAERFGWQYRIGYDPASLARAEKADPWMMTIPCRFGVIYPRGGNLLAAEMDYHPSIARRLASLPGVVLTQDGDGEKTFTFQVELFDRVAEILRPRKRRQVPVRQREIGREALARFRQKANPQSDISAQGALAKHPRGS
jgi:hypothetical protein